MRSLGVILALALAGLQLLAVAVIVMSSYLTSERALLDQARNLLTDVGTNVIAHSKGFLSPARSAAEVSTTLAESRIVQQEQRVLLERLLFRNLRAAPQFAGAYYGDEDGNFVFVKRDADGTFQTKIIDVESEDRVSLIWRTADFVAVRNAKTPDDPYDPRKRVWYQKASSEMQSIWTDPYIFFTSQSPGITAAAPVMSADGQLQGVVGVDIEISSISSFLAELKIGEHGAAFIVDRKGDVIAHPNRDLLTTRDDDGTLRFPSIDEIDDPLARVAYRSLGASSGSSGSSGIHADFEYDGKRYVSLVMPFDVEDIPWTIVVYAPEDDFIGRIRVNRAQNSAIAFAVASMTGLLGLVLANRISQPVRAFAVRSALISQGELDPNEPMPATYKELENANDTLVHEISQRRKTESEYRLTFDMASRGMVHIEPQSGRILTMNAKFAEILGYDPTEVEGWRLRSFLHPDDVEFLEEITDSLARQEVFGVEGRALRKDGETIWISVNGIFVHDEGSGADYVVATIDDVTQGKMDEQKIDHLSREVANFSRQTMMGELATGLAHELNQPLTAITQNIDAATTLASRNGGVDGDLARVLGEIDQQAHQAADIIRALRGFVRKDDNAATDFDIVQLLVHARRLVRSEARGHAIDIVIGRSAPIKVQAVRVQVAQVVVNLLRNAIESISESDPPRRKITARAMLRGRTVKVEIEDTGPGVREDLDMFRAFETTKADGMGLGLSISRSLIEANEGELWYDRGAKGARFCFTLKAAT